MNYHTMTYYGWSSQNLIPMYQAVMREPEARLEYILVPSEKSSSNGARIYALKMTPLFRMFLGVLLTVLFTEGHTGTVATCRILCTSLSLSKL